MLARALFIILLWLPGVALADDAWEIRCYWSVDELYIVFNGIASIMRSAGFASLSKATMLYGTMVVLLATMYMRNFVILPWFTMALLIYSLVTLPVATVAIIDKTGSQPPRTVANVPAMLAATASFMTQGSDFFTRVFEASYSVLPGVTTETAAAWDKLSFRDHDLGFGHRMLRESRQMRIADPILQADMAYFTRDCVNAGFAEGRLDFKTVFQGNTPSDSTTGTWAYIARNVNPARITTYHGKDGSVKLGYCDEVANGTGTVATAGDPGLTQRLDDGVQKATLYYGKKFNKDDVTGTIFAGNLANAYAVLLNSSMNASEIIKQNMFINLYNDSQGAIGRMMNDPSAVQAAYAKAQAVAMTNSSYVTSAAIAEQTMPKMRNAIELMVYTAFPIISLLMMVAGHQSLPVFKGWVIALFWVNMWPPLYAIVNMIGNSITMKSLVSKAALSGGLSIQTADVIGTAVISDQAMMGYLVVLVPAIAYMLAKGITDISGSWLQTAMKSAQVAGAGTSLGNVNQGNVSMDNASANKVDMSGSYAEPTRYQQTTGSGWTNTFGAGDSHVMDGSKAVDNLGAYSIKGGTRLASTAQRQSEEAETAAVGNMQSYAETTAATLQKQSAFERAHGRGARAGEHSGVGQGSSRGQEASQALDLVGQFAKDHSLTQKQSAQILLQAKAEAKIGGGIPLTDTKASIGAAAQMTGKSDAEAGQLLKAAHQFNEKTGFSQKVDSSIKASQERTFDTSDDSSRRGMEAIRGGYDQGRQSLDQASANYQHSQSYKRALAKISEEGFGLDRKMDRDFKMWIADQDDGTGSGRKHGLGGAIGLIASGSTRVDDYARQFLKEVEGRELQRLGITDPGDGKGVRQVHQENATGIKGPSAVTAQGADWQAKARTEAARAGVDPRQAVTSAVPAQAAARIEADRKNVAQGEANVSRQGGPLKNKAREETQPGSQNLTAKAATNGVAQVMPDVVSKGLTTKLPGMNMSVGTPGAAVAEASAARAEKNKKDW